MTWVKSITDKLILSKQMAWIVGGQIGSALLTVLAFRVMGEVAGADGFGKAILLFGIVLLLSGLAAGPIAQSIGRFYFDADDRVAQGLLWYSALCVLCVGFLLGLVVLLGLLVSGWVTGWTAFALLCLTLFMEMIRPLCMMWLHSGSKFPAVAVSQWVDGLLRPLLAILAFNAGFGAVEIVLIAYAFSGVISVGVLLVNVLPNIPLSRPNLVEMRKISVYGRPLLANSLFGWFANAGDRYLVAAAIDARAAGIYVAASALGGRLSLMLGTVFDTYYRPRLYGSVAAHELTALRSVCVVWLKNIAVSGGLLLVGLLVGMPWIQRFLLAPEFRDGSAPIIMISFIAFLVIAVGYIPQRINYAFERTARVAIVEITGMLTTLTAVFFLGQAYGLTGAVTGLFLSGLIRLGMAVITAKLTLKESGIVRV